MKPFRVCTLTAAVLCAATSAQAALFAGVEFPQGVSSFADAVVSYDPVIKSGQPVASVRNAPDALGAPDYDSSGGFVTLGDGGSITLRFVDNKLTGSGDNKKDLWVFEIGPDVEDTFVEVSKDGNTWFAVGKVFGSTAGVDVDAFGFGVNDRFEYVRLTDDTNEGDQTGNTVGADIDAVGAISSVATPPTPAIPEPSTWALMALGLAGLGLQARRRAQPRE